MASDLPRFAKLNTAQQVPSPQMVPIPSFTTAWVAGAFTTSTHYYKLTSLRKSRNATAVWEGETTATAEQVLAGAASKDRARLVVTLNRNADGFRVYQRLTIGAEKLWAEIRVTRNQAGDITGAALQSPYNAGTIASTTATTVTWDSPSGAAEEASGSNPDPPTIDTAQVDYLVMVDRLFHEGGGWSRKVIRQELADGSNAGNILGHVVELDFSVETSTVAAETDMRTLLGWPYVRMWLLPETYYGRTWDGFFDAAVEEVFMTAWETGPKRWMLPFRGAKSYATPESLLTV
jgi:hypothetical protein